MTSAREARLQRLYSISEAEYEQIFAYQSKVCPICQEDTNAKGQPKKFGVDHDHTSGLTRGIACFNCNRKLSEWWTPERLRAALDYLENPPATQALGEPRFGRKGRITNRRRKKRSKK